MGIIFEKKFNKLKSSFYFATILVLFFYILAIVLVPSIVEKVLFLMIIVLVIIQTYRLYNIDLSIEGWIYGEIKPTTGLYIYLLPFPALLDLILINNSYIFLGVFFIIGITYLIYKLINLHNSYFLNNPANRTKEILRSEKDSKNYKILKINKKIVIKSKNDLKMIKRIIKHLKD